MRGIHKSDSFLVGNLATDSGGSGLASYFGDGSDGTLDLTIHPAQQITAPNGGNPATLTDGNVTTQGFVTNSLSASGLTIFQVDFGQDVAVQSFTLKAASCGYTQGGVYLTSSYSSDGVNWTNYSGQTAINYGAGADINVGVYGLARYFRIVTASSYASTYSIAESVPNFGTGTFNFPVTIHAGLILRNYTSINIPAGYTLTASNPCRGMILYSQGNVTNAGTITMTSCAGFGTGDVVPMIIGKLKSDLATKELTAYYQMTTVLQALKGGAGGNSSGTGGPGRINAGGYGGGGSGGYGSAGPGSVANIVYAELGGGAGGAYAYNTSSYIASGGNSTHGGGSGGGGGNLSSSSGGGGGANQGGGGGGGGSGGNSGGGPGYYGGAGNWAGGLVLIIAGGNVTNSAGSVISANGGSGGVGGNSVTGGGNGAGGGGAGGGVVAIYYKGTYTNSGSITVAGGPGGASGTGGNGGGAGGAGAVGTIVTQKVA